jgi:hypothetical protein
MACWLRTPAGPFTSKAAGSLRRETPKDLIPDDTLIQMPQGYSDRHTNYGDVKLDAGKTVMGLARGWRRISPGQPIHRLGGEVRI